MIIIDDKTVPVETACLMGIARYQEKRTDKAVEIFKSILDQEHTHARVLNAMAIIVCAKGEFDEAFAYLDRLLTVHPTFEKGHNTLGMVFQGQGKTEEACNSFSRAITLNPSFAEGHGNLGDIYLMKGRWDDAIDSYRRVVALLPDSAPACYGEGRAHFGKQRYQEALDCFRKALQLKPNFDSAYLGAGNALRSMGQFENAVAAFQAGLLLAPASAALNCDLAVTFLETGCIDPAIEKLREGLKYNPRDKNAHSNLLLAMHYTGACSPAEILAESIKWEGQHALRRITPRAPTGDLPIRIGYVSPDFKHHVITFFFEPLLAAHDRSRFQIYCYSDVVTPDSATQSLKKLADNWLDTAGIPDQTLAERISADRIDVLVDLSGHTCNNRLQLFTLKPAPVQVSWLGYPGTTGLTAMDYRISDEVADPPGKTECFHSETIVRLPDIFLCYFPRGIIPQVSVLPALASRQVTFGSFNNLSKITPEVLALWAKLLKRVPRSCLMLKSKWFCDENTCERYRRLLEAEGIGRHRIRLLRYARTTPDHLACYGKIDIALDTFPYNGTTTTLDALSMGVPVVTLAGDHHAARVGASILTTIGMKEMVAGTAEEYLAIAEQLAHDLQRLTGIRLTLRERLLKSPLCDATTFARHMEAAYVAMLDRCKEASHKSG
jgi:protein O-GlcNAc transferase